MINVARIPGMVWVGVLIVAFAGMFVVGIYGAGRRSGKAEVRRAALADSAGVAHVKVADATRRSDSTGQVARNWRAQTTGSSTRFARQRAAAVSAADTATLLDSASAMIKNLETTVQVQVTHSEAQSAERLVRIEADTIEAHQIALAEPSSGISAGDVAKGVGVAVVVVGVVLWIVHAVAK